MKIILAVFTVLMIFSSCLLSQEFKPEVKIGATVFTGWEFNMDNAEFISKLDTNSPNSNIPFGFNPSKNQFETSKNSFFLERSYINILASLTPDLKARVTPDVFSITDGSGKTQYFLALKYAFIDYTPVINDNGMSLGFQLGVIANRWINTNDKYWGYRGFQKSFTDFSWTTAAVRNGNTVTRTTSSFFSSADLGLELYFNAPKGFAEIGAAIFNGNGYRNLGYDNRFKDVMVSAFIHPLAGNISKKTAAMKKAGKDRIDGITDLTLGGFLYMGKLDKGENPTPNAVQYKRNRFGGMAHLRLNFKKAGFFKIGGEYSMAKNEDAGSPVNTIAETNSNGLSAYLEFNPPVASINEKLMLVARYDMFDPNDKDTTNSLVTFNDSNDKQKLMILGLAFRPNKLLTLGLTYQGITYDDNFVVKYDGTTTKSDARLIFHGILNF
jgi:hypothetical protein